MSENYNSMMACLAVSDGTIVIGGVEMINSVYLFKMEKWYSIGTLSSVCSVLTYSYHLSLRQNHRRPAAIQFNDVIYTVGDNMNEFFIYDNTTLADDIDIEPCFLYNSSFFIRFPLLLESKYDSCI